MNEWMSRYDIPRPATYPVSCEACGCRLMPASDSDAATWRHLPSLDPLRDARGDRPACIDALHDSEGRVLD
jgi:hypothetical protein